MTEEGNTEIVETKLFIINVSIATSRPLDCWKQSLQIMIEKGKGNYIENLKIIQLCEADLKLCPQHSMREQNDPNGTATQCA